MFYSNEILTRRKGPLGVIWIAATLGNKSSLKKLSKKDVNGVNLVSACEYIAKPPEPMALRLTSNLMVGVTRVYNAQYGFYMNEVNNTFLRLKQNLAKLNFEADVTMPATEARYETITMEDDPNFELPGTTLHNVAVEADTSFSALPPLAVDFGWVRPSERPNVNGSESAVDSASFAASYNLDDPFISAPADQRSASISLQMPPPASSGSMSFLGGPAADFGGLDLGLDEELGWGDGQNLFDVEGNAAPITGGNEVRVAHPNQDTTGINDNILDKDYAEVVRGDHGRRPDSRKGTSKRNIGKRPGDQSHFQTEEEESVVPDSRFENQDFQEMEIDYFNASMDFPANLPIVPGTDVMHQVEQPAGDLQLAENGDEDVPIGARKPRVPKPGRFIDATTQLMPLEMARLREGRLSDEEVSSRQSERGEIQKEKQSILNAIAGRLADDIVAPELHDLWDAIVGQKRVLGEQGRQGSGNRAKKAKVNKNEFADASDRVVPRTADEGNISGDYYANAEENPFDNGQWDAGNAWDDAPNKSQVIDNHSNPSFESEMLRGGNDSYSLTGPVSVEKARRNRTLKPWEMITPMDQTDAASSVAASGGSKNKGTPLGTTFKGEFKPESGRSRRASSIGGSGSLMFGLSPGPSGYASDIGPQEFTFDDGEMNTEGGQIPFQDSQIRVAALEKETGNFYDYARSLVTQAGVDHVYFSDLLPGTHSTREAAASAFYHVLVLSTRSMIRPAQTDPYSDIKIELI